MNEKYARNTVTIDDVPHIYWFYLHLNLMSETLLTTGVQKLLLVRNKLIIMWKEAVVASFNVQYRNFPGMAVAIRDKPQRVWSGPRPGVLLSQTRSAKAGASFLEVQRF